MSTEEMLEKLAREQRAEDERLANLDKVAKLSADFRKRQQEAQQENMRITQLNEKRARIARPLLWIAGGALAFGILLLATEALIMGSW